MSQLKQKAKAGSDDNKAKAKVAEAVLSETKIEETTGIVLIALGHPMYTHYAYNLAVSLKFHNYNIPICIVTKGGGWDYLFPDQQALFDQRIEAKDEWIYGVHGMDYFKAKLHLDEITPFTNTLYLDVDMIWNNNKTVQDMLYEVSGYEFAICNRGRITTPQKLVSEWIEMKQLKEVYDIDSIYDVSSEVIYFKQGTKVFEQARKVYDENKLTVRDFGGGKPDEVYLSVAIEQLQVKLHASPWMPTYWQPYYFTKWNKEEYILNHYATSIGGAFIQNNTQKIYNRLCRHYFNRMGIPHTPYQQQAKSRILKERRHI